MGVTVLPSADDRFEIAYWKLGTATPNPGLGAVPSTYGFDAAPGRGCINIQCVDADERTGDWRT
jgi:hypothetical protein